MFPELRFALDGNLVGDIGEAIAMCDFGLVKLDAGSKLHDFRARDGTRVQVKTTQQTALSGSIGLGRIKQSFDHLIVIQLLEDGDDILYDGHGKHVDEACSHKSSAFLSVSQLRRLDEQVRSRRLLPKRKP